ncbi:hypothetical protein AJ78_01052 [Emergomyces pasteurianus Ep9510]|uniref:Uncharacterized protein n=1 Tax=Emergomyces pasteurianus Ep9510 TaxID=1447872 RepID=A0A1J9QSU0_9EURO|nr:hypothetical protein AJ78_01052 [Emergomyces pasteurianus Ep9510]
MAPIPLSTTSNTGSLQNLARNIAQLDIFSNPRKRTTLSSQRNAFSPSSLARSFLARSRDMAQSISPSASYPQRRDSMISIPSTYSSFTSSPGTVVGIVVGTVGGFVVLIWILFLIFGGRVTTVDDMTTVTDDSRPPPPRRSQSHRRRPEVIEVMSESTSSRSEDVIEVFEEISTPSQSERRSYSKRTGSYRTVDPREYGGGRAPGRRVRH